MMIVNYCFLIIVSFFPIASRDPVMFVKVFVLLLKIEIPLHVLPEQHDKK
jgi:hypothetical protein